MDVPEPGEKAIFNVARGIEEPEARRLYVERACGEDRDLRARVEALLRMHDLDITFLRSSAEGFRAGFPGPARAAPGTVIGPYRLLRLIGEGGMGTVFLAEQEQPVRRLVALKLIRAGMDSARVLARFEAERQALALMDHPNIARILDADATPEGGPYFVMELVEGVPITAYCDGHRLTPRQRLELFVPVCWAVQHAHQKGVIHRDLKPSNVLVSLYDGKAVPKVIDFGLAKATGQKLTGRTLVTESGSLIGTLEYMSPEQAGANQLDIDTRSDCYSLGVLLYELLTGSTPLQRRGAQHAGLLDLVRMIREEEPARPSTRLGAAEELPSIAARRGVEPKKLGALVRGELDWIVMKCLEKDRSRRYETADALARDIERYLRDEPVEASPPVAAYRLGKFARRHRKALATAAAFALLLLAATGVSAWLAARATAARDRERVAKDLAQRRERETRAVMDELSSAVIDGWLTRQTHMTPELKEFLSRGLAYYEAFTRETGHTPEGRAALAQAYRRVGVIRWRLGLRQEAEAALRQAVQLWEGLVRESPADTACLREEAGTAQALARVLTDRGGHREAAPLLARAIRSQREGVRLDVGDVKGRVNLARLHRALGSLRRALRLWGEAEASCREAITILTELAEAFPGDPNHRVELAAALQDQAILLDLQNRLAESVASSRRGIAIRNKLAEDFPFMNEYRHHLAQGHITLGVTLAKQRRLFEARDALGESLAVMKALVADFSSVPRYRQDLASGYNNLAIVLEDLGDIAGSTDATRQAITLREQLLKESPDDLNYAVTLGGAYGNLAALLADQGRPADSLAWYDRAVRTLVPALAREPRHGSARQFLRNAHSGRAHALDRLGRAADAAGDWERAGVLDDGNRRLYYEARRALSRGDHARAVDLARKQAKARAVNGKTVFDCARVCGLAAGAAKADARSREEYAGGAIELLRQAVDAGYAGPKRDAGTDEAFEALRGREAFQQLLKRLKAPAADQGPVPR